MSKAAELAALIGSQTALSNRNLIINGAMQVAQRGTSVTGSTAGGAFHTVDRFANHGSDATYDSTQESVTLGGETGLPVQFKNYHKFNVTTGANNSGIWQTIEGVDRVQGKHTLSFYAKGVNPAGGVVALETRQYFGSSGSSEIDVDIDTFVLTSSWQRFTFTFDVASVSGKTIAGGNDYFRVFLHQPEGDAGTAAWNLQITGVQLEVGEQATPFEHRSFADELWACKRYYNKIGGSGDWEAYASQVLTSIACRATVHWDRRMRARPSITWDNGSTNYVQARNNNYTITGFTTAHYSDKGAIVDAASTSMTQGDGSIVLFNTDNTQEFDAEL